MTGWVTAGLYGFLSASGLIAGAVAALSIRMRHRTVAAVTAIGVGLLIGAASLHLVSSAMRAVPPSTVALGALGGAALFSLSSLALRRWGAEKRKRCGECVAQPNERDTPGSGLAIAFGSMLDAVPEALIIGAAAAGGGKAFPPMALIAAFALGNFAEGLSGTAGMREAGRSRLYVLLLWGAITFITAAAAMLGFMLFTGESVERGWLESVAAGALMALVVETMAPEAVAGRPGFTGLLATAGFLGVLLALSA